jgi:tetratricopeptide (TPR) repeat protein
MWSFAEDSLDRAHRLLNDALALTGDNALLVSALGMLHILYTDAGVGDAARHIEAAEQYARRLESLAPDSVGLHALRGGLHWRRGEIREAIASLTRAHELEPNRADVLANLCYAYLLAGQDDRAREAADLTVRLDPLTPLFQCMPGFCEAMAGRSQAAVPHYRRFLEMDPSNPAAYLYLAWTLAEAGETAEALEKASELTRRFPESPFGRFGLALAHALRGETTAGKAALTSDVRRLSRTSEAFARPLACILAMLGDLEGAIDALEDAVRLGLAHYPVLAHRSRLLAPLRGHPRFQRLLEVVRERWERGGTSAEDLAQPSPAAVGLHDAASSRPVSGKDDGRTT